jgi:ABC-type Na+ transport system ATPase subunit NatA
MDIDDEMSVILLMLFLNSLLWSAIGMYLQKVAPSEDSVQKDCCFCITEPVHYFCCGGRANLRQIHGADAGTDKNYGQRLQDAGYGDANAGGAVVAGVASGGEEKTGSAVVASATNRLANPLLKRRPSMLKATVQEDEDVIEERNNMISGAFPANAPIQLFGLRKMFGSFVAVDNVSLHIPTNQCFGMLGPNGAGKTTTISMLTGLIPASKGDAVVANKDLHNELSGIYENIGVCPQFDVTWPELTIEEHLIFYARVKGVPKEAEHLEIMKLIKDIGLMDAHVKKSTSKALSGGMRRRLSLAIALVGKPPVVFLDEPTTGLDPETKRNIWALIDTFKKNR